MKRLLVSCCLAIFVSVSASDTASAQGPDAYGFLPFGFYQPYGSRYGNSLRTPPYFSLSPPVYYGARHARPYGLSPFASPPLVSASENYDSRLRSQFVQPQVPTPGPAARGLERCNPCVSQSDAVQATYAKVTTKIGEVRSNPFVETKDMVATN
ncbi:MAG: hypothetical protein ACR2NZ_13910 [Rubripirellula sp.]